jgi:uncharacterized membrane protein YkoI
MAFPFSTDLLWSFAMRLTLTAFALVMIGMGSSTVAVAKDDDGKIELGKVPPAVRRAALKAVPGLKLTEAYMEDDEGETLYTLDGQLADDRDVEVEVTAKGEVLSVSIEIELRAVPKVVSTALRTKLKGFKPTAVMQVSEKGQITSYAFEGKDADGEEIDVTVTADGSKVEVELDEG